MEYTIFETEKEFFVTTNVVSYRTFCKKVGTVKTKFAIKNSLVGRQICAVGNGAKDEFRVPKHFTKTVEEVKELVNSLSHING